MSSPDTQRRTALLPVLLTLAATLALAGCFRPLYATSANGVSVRDELATIDVGSVPTAAGQERLGHYLRNELVFQLTGGAPPVEKRYRLEMSVSENVETAIVNSETGNAESATLNGTAHFTVKPIAGGNPVVDATATASASYDRNPQRFASLRAAREAEILVAKQLAEQIKTRLAALLASGALKGS